MNPQEPTTPTQTPTPPPAETPTGSTPTPTPAPSGPAPASGGKKMPVWQLAAIAAVVLALLVAVYMVL